MALVFQHLREFPDGPDCCAGVGVGRTWEESLEVTGSPMHQDSLMSLSACVPVTVFSEFT